MANAMGKLMISQCDFLGMAVVDPQNRMVQQQNDPPPSQAAMKVPILAYTSVWNAGNIDLFGEIVMEQYVI